VVRSRTCDERHLPVRFRHDGVSPAPSTPLHFSSSVTFAIHFLVRGMRAVLTHYAMRERVDELNVWEGGLQPQLEYLGQTLPDTA
jgi:hypothetical protein